MQHRQIGRRVDLDADRGAGRFRADQDDCVVDQRPDVDGADMRLAAAQELAHPLHDAGGMIDLGDHGGEIVVDAGLAAAVAVQQVLGRPAERARGRDRLVDLVRERGGHAADEIEARGLIRFRFLGAQQRLDLAHRAVGLLALVDDHADGQSGGGQHQHQDLEFGEHVGVIAVEVQEPDQAELGQGEAEAGAVEPVADRRHHHRQEEQIEQLEAALALGQRR